ncbi:glycosyltransferase [Stutzerimonas tarimensis]|uniref:Glycosyltransferase n=1 Tax=Stutzerimonas tarimensis TaxID=1507735 RepID=A0ABV7T847_9GAMM
MDHPIFLSLVVTVRNQSALLEELIGSLCARIGRMAQDYELIIIDNASEDNSVAMLKRLTEEQGLPNLQVYALTKEVDADTASWVGLENALGDYVAIIDPLVDDVEFLPSMLSRAVEGADVVFACNRQKPPQSLSYRMASAAFDLLYKSFHGIHLSKDAPKFRVINKKIINFILQHPQPAVAYRYLPATAGFIKANLEYSAAPRSNVTKRLGESIDRGIRLLVSTTRAPMRIVTSLSLFGALASLLYSIYVVLVGLLKENVAPGWVSLSLQQSGMFFLISGVLLVLGEYILHMASLSNEGPPYHVTQEFTSVKMSRREKLNIEEVDGRVG